jgi:D-arabinose 5-phosphate isomerase GutQ
MHAGNHSPCHPLDTLLEAARRLSNQAEIVFCFVGGGSEQHKVKTFAARYGLKNILCLPYQPLAELSGLLSAADLHVVVMGEQFTGIVHPCKVYNILAVGKPFLYIGPKESHITDIAQLEQKDNSICAARHGDVETVVNHILKAASSSRERAAFAASCGEKFSRASLMPVMIDLFEPVSATSSVGATTVSQTSV